MRGEITVGEFTMFNLYLTRLIWRFDRARLRRESLSTRDCEFEETQRVLRDRAVDRRCAGVVEQPPIKGKIEIRDLTFSYHPTDEPVIKDLTLTIPQVTRLLLWDAPAAESRRCEFDFRV